MRSDGASIASTQLFRVPAQGPWSRDEDLLAVEEPLEIRLGDRSLSITMRTPGHDFELAAGFLLTEGIVRQASDIEKIEFCGPSGNVVRVELSPRVSVDLKRLERHFYTSSSCGVCGKTSIEALRVTIPEEMRSAVAPAIQVDVLRGLPGALRKGQGLFNSTGGIHASALFDLEGKPILVREDVGRHNALDKLIGASIGELPLRSHALLVSGRASFELVQKAAVSGISIFAAVGAPSSLAVELARDVGMTLVGFLREGRFNIYHGQERILA